jgi:hypothetical protein
MGTGKQRISLGERPAARVVDRRVLGLVLVPVVAELAHDPVAVELELAPVVVELEPDPVAAELEHVPVAGELELDQAAAELERVPVVAELEPDQAAVLVQDHRPAQLAVALRTKSVIAAHHPDLVPLLEAEEDLAAAVAETTLEPVAAEAAKAWAAAE